MVTKLPSAAGLMAVISSLSACMVPNNVTSHETTGTLLNDGQSTVVLDARLELEQEYTVRFSTGPIVERATGKSIGYTPVNPVAEIKWRIGDAILRRVVNAVDGMAITGIGESVEVTVIDRSFSNFYNSPVQYEMWIGVDPGSRRPDKRPTLALPGNQSFKFVVGSMGSSGKLTIPEDSGVDSVYVSVSSDEPIPDQAAQVQVYDQGGSLQLVADPRIGWVALTPGATEIMLDNNSDCEQIFTVTFGVDG